MTRKRWFSAVKEFFCNYEDDFVEDDKWFNNGNPVVLFLNHYKKEIKSESNNILEKRIEKPQKKSAPQKMYNKDEISEIEKLKKKNLRPEKLLMQKKRKEKNTAILKRRNVKAHKKKRTFGSIQCE